jgi:hypothetical protein
MAPGALGPSLYQLGLGLGARGKGVEDVLRRPSAPVLPATLRPFGVDGPHPDLLDTDEGGLGGHR